MTPPKTPTRSATRSTRSRPFARGARACIAGTLICACLCVTGCQKTALRPDDTRSQFDRYDRARSQRAEPYLQDEYGRRTPNLTERLLLREE